MEPAAIYDLSALQDVFYLASQPRKQTRKVLYGVEEFGWLNFQSLQNRLQVRRN